MPTFGRAYLVKIPPRAIFYSQIIKSVVGVFVGTAAYRLYSSAKTIPIDKLPVPYAHLWLVAARLVYEWGLPPKSLSFAIPTLALGALGGIIRIANSNRWLRELVP
jgi:hypothetical protein